MYKCACVTVSGNQLECTVYSRSRLELSVLRKTLASYLIFKDLHLDCSYVADKRINWYHILCNPFYLCVTMVLDYQTSWHSLPSMWF